MAKANFQFFPVNTHKSVSDRHLIAAVASAGTKAELDAAKHVREFNAEAAFNTRYTTFKPVQATDTVVNDAVTKHDANNGCSR